jgi:hypothetical protein
MKYFHQLDFNERFTIYNQRTPWSKTSKVHPQPPWCSHAQAVDGILGCQDLWLGFVRSPKECEDCKFYINNKG